jgi:type IV pilus biogenesis protein CpaD/CtpE
MQLAHRHTVKVQYWYVMANAIQIGCTKARDANKASNNETITHNFDSSTQKNVAANDTTILFFDPRLYHDCYSSQTRRSR